jgi:dihydroorotase
MRAKRGGDKIPPGVFPQPYATQYVVDALDQACENGMLREDITQDIFEGFLGRFDRAFYRMEEFIALNRTDDRIMDVPQISNANVEVVPFGRGQKAWSITWI